MFVILWEVAQDYPDVIKTSLANARSKKMGSRREALFAAFKAKVEEESGLVIDWDWNHYHKYAVDFFGNRYATLEKTYLRTQAGEASG